MSHLTLLEQLQRDDELRDVLDWPFDFNLNVATDAGDWFEVRPVAESQIIAQDGTGGVFLLYGPKELLIHVTSEGQAGVLARDLEEGLRLMVAHPNWRDLLKFSGGGRLEEMRRVDPYMKRELYEDHPAIDEQQRTIKQKLGLDDAVDAIASLHAAMTTLGEGFSIVGADGMPLESLFNKFTVDDNPMWNQA